MAPFAHRSADDQFEFLDVGYQAPADESRIARFGFRCPRGRGWCTGLLLTTPAGFQRAPGGPSVWDWDGNIDAPTFKPSINCLSQDKGGRPLGGCGWHGYIEGGKFRDA